MYFWKIYLKGDSGKEKAEYTDETFWPSGGRETHRPPKVEKILSRLE